ncbi:MAG: hypothetical protein DHS20C01_33800 [marine bacterium B5-7]|nr:MAG: hypothetical protein DHS20C01_33800 [marine bacterium B5-7]
MCMTYWLPPPTTAQTPVLSWANVVVTTEPVLAGPIRTLAVPPTFGEAESNVTSFPLHVTVAAVVLNCAGVILFLDGPSLHFIE